MPLAAVQATPGCMDIPERVAKFVTEYWICRSDDCKQVYWVGPKYADASAKFRKLFTNSVSEGTGDEEAGASTPAVPL